MKSKLLSRGLPIISVLVISVAGYGWWNHTHAGHNTVPAPQPPIIQAIGGLPDFSAIVQTYGPAVVNITSTSTAKQEHAQMPGMSPDDPMYEFFRRFGMPPNHPDVDTHQSQGSGFIVNPDGVVLTNAHVVDDASEVMVKLTDKRELRAKVIGLDKASDVAVLKIDARDLPYVRLGEAAKVNVGEWVLAIGSPFGFENSATAGIVSAKARSLPDENYVPFIQTDVAVNPGNSGGPLFNLHGEVIGINAQIYSQSGGYQGLSFAIPIDLAMQVEKQILEHGKVVRGRIGASIQDLNQDLAESFGLKSAQGALVASVEEGSPAQAAGLQAGDVVLAVDGKPILSSSGLPPRVAELKPGSQAKLDIWHDHHNTTLTVTIGQLQERAQVAQAGPAESGRLGLAVRPINPEERKQFKVEAGLVVLESSGPAARAGIHAGDVVLAANGTPVDSADQLRQFVHKAGHHLALLVLRDGNRLYVPINLG